MLFALLSSRNLNFLCIVTYYIPLHSVYKLISVCILYVYYFMHVLHMEQNSSSTLYEILHSTFMYVAITKFCLYGT